MKEPILNMGDQAELIIKKISAMVGSAAKEDKTKIQIPIDQVQYLIHSIKYAYASGVIGSAMDSSLINDSLSFCKFFHEEYGE